jgi:hypothetical protein
MARGKHKLMIKGGASHEKHGKKKGRGRKRGRKGGRKKR